MESNAEKLDREPRNGLMDVMTMAGERGEGLHLGALCRDKGSLTS